MESALPSAVALGILALVALGLTLGRGPVSGGTAPVRIAAVATACQAVHFLEELFTGLPERLPALFDRGAMAVLPFVSFNVAWLAVWAVSVFGISRGAGAARFPLWFLAVAGTANGLLHPALAVVTGGYFPGLWSSPLIGVSGLLLLWGLLRATGPA